MERAWRTVTQSLDLSIRVGQQFHALARRETLRCQSDKTSVTEMRGTFASTKRSSRRRTRVRRGFQAIDVRGIARTGH